MEAIVYKSVLFNIRRAMSIFKDHLGCDQRYHRKNLLVLVIEECLFNDHSIIWYISNFLEVKISQIVDEINYKSVLFLYAKDYECLKKSLQLSSTILLEKLSGLGIIKECLFDDNNIKSLYAFDFFRFFNLINPMSKKWHLIPIAVQFSISIYASF